MLLSLRRAALAFFILFLNSKVALGQEEHFHCESAYNLACPRSAEAQANNTYEQPHSYRAIQNVIRKNRTLQIPHLVKAFGLPENSRARNRAIKTIGLDELPDCKSEFSAAKQRCNIRLAKDFLDIAALELTPFYEPENELPQYYEALESIRSGPLYEEFALELSRNSDADLETGSREARVRDTLLPRTKRRLISVLNTMEIPEAKKSKLIARINGVEFGGSDCGSRANGERPRLQQTLQPNAFFDGSTETISICRSLLTSTFDERSVMFVLAHELAHSIDPCSLSKKNKFLVTKSTGRNLDEAEAEFPMPHLLRCLRNNKSIVATRFEDVLSVGLRKLFGNSTVFCSADEIGESFSDWFAVEVMALELKARPLTERSAMGRAHDIVQAAAPLCYSHPSQGTVIHPAPVARIDRLLIQQPHIRTTMGCSGYSSDAGYCNGKTDRPITPELGRRQNSQPARRNK